MQESLNGHGIRQDPKRYQRLEPSASAEGEAPVDDPPVSADDNFKCPLTSVVSFDCL
jgi:hypothetical protein